MQAPTDQITENTSNAITINNRRYYFVRDPSTQKIVGARSETGEFMPIDHTRVPDAPAVHAPSKKNQDARPDQICDESGGDSIYVSRGNVLPPVEIHGSSTNNVPFFIEKVLGPIQEVGSGEVGSSPPPQTSDKTERCQAEANNCLEAAKTGWRATTMGNVCVTATATGAARWGAWVGVIIAAACKAAEEYWLEARNTQCFAKHANCMNS